MCSWLWAPVHACTCRCASASMYEHVRTLKLTYGLAGFASFASPARKPLLRLSLWGVLRPSFQRIQEPKQWPVPYSTTGSRDLGPVHVVFWFSLFFCEIFCHVTKISLFSAKNWSLTNFFALSAKNLSGNKLFCFSCQNLVMRQIFSHFLPKIGHETNNFTFPAKIWSWDKYQALNPDFWILILEPDFWTSIFGSQFLDPNFLPLFLDPNFWTPIFGPQILDPNNLPPDFCSYNVTL